MADSKAIIIDNNQEYEALLQHVGESLEAGRRSAVAAVNTAMVQTYWRIGKDIVEYEQHGEEKALCVSQADDRRIECHPDRSPGEHGNGSDLHRQPDHRR